MAVQYSAVWHTMADSVVMIDWSESSDWIDMLHWLMSALLALSLAFNSVEFISCVTVLM